MLHIAGAFAELEREIIRERVRAAACLALGERLAEQPLGNIGVKTHIGLQAIVMPATCGAPRAEILRTIVALVLKTGRFGEATSR